MATEAPKKSFLACYDYGMGGVWCVMRARSGPEIEEKIRFRPSLKNVRRGWAMRFMGASHLSGPTT